MKHFKGSFVAFCAAGIRITYMIVRNPVAVFIHTADKPVQSLGRNVVGFSTADKGRRSITALYHVLGCKRGCQSIIGVYQAKLAGRSGVSYQNVRKLGGQP